jgi:hypothetical protein
MCITGVRASFREQQGSKAATALCHVAKLQVWPEGLGGREEEERDDWRRVRFVLYFSRFERGVYRLVALLIL